MPTELNESIKKIYKDKTCFDITMQSDEKIIKFLEEDPFNFVIEIDKKIFCGNKKQMLTRRTVKNDNLVYLCKRVTDHYNISRDNIVLEIPYLRLESVGLSQGQVLVSYNNIIEVIINSDDQIFVCKAMYQSGLMSYLIPYRKNILSSISTVALSVYINKGSVVSAAHCQAGGDYPIYSVYSVTHPDEKDKLNSDYIVPRSIKNKDINEIRRDIDVRLGLDKDELVYVYFPKNWSMVLNGQRPDYGLSKPSVNDPWIGNIKTGKPLDWWNIKDGGIYKLQNDLIEIDDVTGRETNNEHLILKFLEKAYYYKNDHGIRPRFARNLTAIVSDQIRETLEKQVQRPDELKVSIDDFIKKITTPLPFTDPVNYKDLEFVKNNFEDYKKILNHFWQNPTYSELNKVENLEEYFILFKAMMGNIYAFVPILHYAALIEEKEEDSYFFDYVHEEMHRVEDFATYYDLNKTRLKPDDPHYLSEEQFIERFQSYIASSYANLGKMFFKDKEIRASWDKNDGDWDFVL